MRKKIQKINISNFEEERIKLFDSNNTKIINNNINLKNKPITIHLILIIIFISILIYSFKQNDHKVSSQKRIVENNLLNNYNIFNRISNISNINNISNVSNIYNISNISNISNINNTYTVNIIRSILNTENTNNISKIDDIRNTININKISNLENLENITNIAYENNNSSFNNVNIIDQQNLSDEINFGGISQKDSFIKGKHFLHDCLRGKLMNNITNKSIDEPEISIIIPIHNGRHYIKNVLRSIQNQNFYSMEIILVDDFSIDGSLNLIKEMQNEDQRIKVIENKKNMGILYTRCMGALAAKGKFI